MRLFRHAMLTAQPLPEVRTLPQDATAQMVATHAHAMESRRLAESARVESWMRLDPDARLAWETWAPVRGQVDLLRADHAEDEHRLTLRMSDVVTSMDWHEVAREDRPAIWDLVMLLHDTRSHDGRNLAHERLHMHAEGAPEYDPACRQCLAMWREVEEGA